MCLLHAVSNAWQQPAHGSATPAEMVQPIVATINHGIRLESSIEVDYVLAAARSLGTPAVQASMRLQPSKASSIMEEARQRRYQLLSQAALEQKATAVLVAHHLGVPRLACSLAQSLSLH